MSPTYYAAYPLFAVAIAKDNDTFDLSILGVDHGQRRVLALPVFSDYEGARDFQEKEWPTASILELVDRDALLEVLTLARQSVSLVAFDPWKVGAKLPFIFPLDDFGFLEDA